MAPSGRPPRVTFPTLSRETPREVHSGMQDVVRGINGLDVDLAIAHEILETKAPRTHVDELSGRLNQADTLIASLIQKVKALDTQLNPPPPVMPPGTGGGGSGGGGGGGGGSTCPTSGPELALAKQIIDQTAITYASLLAVFGTDADALNAAIELLLRIIWHLQQGGFTAGRQRNPSGLISNDKITIFFGADPCAYDIMSLGFAGHATTMVFINVGSPVYVADPGITD